MVEVFVNGKQCVVARVYPAVKDAVAFPLLPMAVSSELKLFGAMANEKYL